MTAPTLAPIRIFLLDDHEVVRSSVARALDSMPDFEVVGQAGNVATALPGVLASTPDVAVLDAQLPDGSGIDVCRDIKAALPDTGCLILSSLDDEDVVISAVLAGASGYLFKTMRMDGLADAIREVAVGRSLVGTADAERMIERMLEGRPTDNRLAGLSPDEREVLNHIADGLNNSEIALRMDVDKAVVQDHVRALEYKLGMQRRTQLAVFGASVR